MRFPRILSLAILAWVPALGLAQSIEKYADYLKAGDAVPRRSADGAEKRAPAGSLEEYANFMQPTPTPTPRPMAAGAVATSSAVSFPAYALFVQPGVDATRPVGWDRIDGTTSVIGTVEHPCCGSQFTWLSADYLLWFVRRQTVPTLVTGVQPQAAVGGQQIQPGQTNWVFPEEEGRLENHVRNGVRVSSGVWLTDNHRLGIDASGFVLFGKQNSNSFTTDAAGFPAYSRYYLNGNGGTDTYLLLSIPNQYTGSITVNDSVSDVWGFDTNLRSNVLNLFADRVDLLLGVRYFDFREGLSISSTTNLAQNLVATGTRLRIDDRIWTRNQFYGAQTGLQATWCFGDLFFVDVASKFAFGSMQQHVSIKGWNVYTRAGEPANIQPFGLYAGANNSGEHARGHAAFLSETTVNLNCRITESCSAFVGYNLIYVSNVVRPGRSIDTTIADAAYRYVANPQPGNSGRPGFGFDGIDFAIQGLNLGLRLDF